MTSIHTNLGAISALQTLRSIDTTMEKTQGQVSSGLRVSTASDNAAYWSISTTMRSDQHAISAVADAIGFSQAILDTQYQATSAVVDALSEVKSRLVLASEEGIDKAKVQLEIHSLQEQVKNINASASFGGVNWINTDIANLPLLGSYEEELPSAFLRRDDGTVSIGTTMIDLAKTSLVNTRGGGTLQAVNAGSTGLVGIENAAHTSGLSPRLDFQFTGPATFSASDVVQFDVVLETRALMPEPSLTLTITKVTVDAALGTTSGTVSTSQQWARVLTYARGALSSDILRFDGANAAGTPGYIGITSNHAPSGRSVGGIHVTNISTSLPLGLGLATPASYPLTVTSAQASFAFSGPVTIQENDPLAFTLRMTGQPSRTIVIDRQLVDNTLGTSDGTISSSADMAQVMTAALSATPVSVTEWLGSIYLNADISSVDVWGPNSYIIISDAETDGYAPDFDFYDIDITKNARTVDQYLRGVDYMLERTTAAASYVGAVQRRLAFQKDLASDLSDSILRGVGRLVDADMSEASTRIRALETQQQLAGQALTIANGNAENIMRLFE